MFQTMAPEILIAAAIGIITLVLLYYLFLRSTSKRPNILITGICDSGKTLLFTQMTQNVYKLTHTSLKENQGSVRVKDSDVTIIDIPGHERLRSQMLERFTSTARAVIFVVDSSTVKSEIKDVAEYLYTLLVDEAVARHRVPVLIACNKQDQSFTKSASVIQTLLEKELTTVRRTRAASLEGTDGASVKYRRLGNDSEDFDFSQLLPQKVSVVECSARGESADGSQPALDEITNWLKKI